MTEETARAGTEARPFVEVWPRSDRRDHILVELVTPMWKFALANLYLTTGRTLPDEAKRDGCVFGFCDERGVQQPKATATHVGWTCAGGAWMKFNVNDTVRVRLTDLGRKTLAVLRADENAKIKARFPEVDALQPLAVPEVEGWSEWVLWEVMATFGEFCGNGSPLMFETEMELIGERVRGRVVEGGRDAGT
jgi:hypothetical protein